MLEKKSLLIEIVQEIISEIDDLTLDRMLDEKGDYLPFDKLFGDDLRKVIPFESNGMSDIKKALEEEGFSVDLENSIVSQSKETREGPKTINMRLGKVLNRKMNTTKNDLMKIINSNPKAKKTFKQFEFEFEFEDPIDEIVTEWTYNVIKGYSPQSEQNFLDQTGLTKEIYLAAAEHLSWKKFYDLYNKEGGGYKIIISRSPIDVLRMSDFKNIQSCHSKGGSYWECAVQEAMTGGGIAYLVKSKDIENIDINSDEIFKDKERDIDGINPISRVRLRNFVIGGNDRHEIAVPENREYGENVSGFIDSVYKWSYNSQIEDFMDDDGNVVLPDQEDIKIKGGNYYDTSPSSLLNKLFKVQKYSGDIDNEDEDESANLFDQITEEADNLYNDFSAEHIDVEYSVEDDDGEQDPFVIWSGTFTLTCPPAPKDEDGLSMKIDLSDDELDAILKEVNASSGRVIEISSDDASVHHYSGATTDYSFDITAGDPTNGHVDEFGDFLEYCKDVNKVYPIMQDVFYQECEKVYEKYRIEYFARLDGKSSIYD